MTNPAAAPAATNKPSNSAFRQQRLVAWQPIMSPPHVVACLVLTAIAFIPVGIAILFANNSVVDVEWRYDNSACTLQNNDGLFKFHDATTGSDFAMGCLIVWNFTLKDEMKAPVYLYYKLTNFYQNHRRFAKSRSETQLAGGSVDSSSASDCDPFITPDSDKAMTVNGAASAPNKMVYSPCGLVPWSMFNDTFQLYSSVASLGGSPQNPTLVCDGTAFNKTTNQNTSATRCHKDGITWTSDADKYKVPHLGDNVWSARRTAYGASELATDNAFLANGWYVNEPGHEVPVTTDQDLQVWMRTSALPSFRKLYRIIDVTLPPGDYTMVIRDFYPVTNFGGTKSFALTTLSWLGGENQFLAIAYLAVGGVAFVLAVIFLVVYKFNGDRMKAAIDSLTELQ